MYFIRNLFKRTDIFIRCFSAEVNLMPSAEKWDLLAGVSIERLPVISRDYNENEKKFSRFLAQLEFQKSQKSNFEIRVENDLKRASMLKEGTVDVTEIDSGPQQTGHDFLDACQDELKSFKLGSRKASEVVEKNLKSTGRALDRRLLLLIQEEIGKKQYWILPHGIYKGEPSLRHTAERVLQEKCGESINARFLGNCPCGIYKYRYPRHARSDSVGAKIFFFKAQLLNGQVDENVCYNFQWATRKELKILPKDYYKTVRKFLIDEEH